MRWFTNVPERIEHATVKLTMNGAAYDRLKGDIKSMGILLDRVQEHDTVHIEYTFTIEYYNIVDALRSLIVLLNDPSVSSAMIGSRDQLNLLFVDLVDAVRTVQKTLEEKVSQ